MKNQVTAQNIYTVSFVSQYSGLSAAVIRIWEKRYQAVNPVRSASNRRLYSEADLLRLQLLKKAVDSGHRISQVANLPADEIAAAVISTDARAAALSLTFSVDQCQLVKEVKKLRHLLREDSFL